MLVIIFKLLQGSGGNEKKKEKQKKIIACKIGQATRFKIKYVTQQYFCYLTALTSSGKITHPKSQHPTFSPLLKNVTQETQGQF